MSFIKITLMVAAAIAANVSFAKQEHVAFRYKRYVWSEIDGKRVCYDDKAGIEVPESYCRRGSASNSAVRNDHATVNDPPNPILKCVETRDNAVVLDGRAEATVAKDQFGQFSVQIVQKDQFSDDNLLAEFLAVEKIVPNQNSLDFDARLPNLIYRANENGKQLSLSLWKSNTTLKMSTGRLVLTTNTPASQRIIALSCKE